MSKIKVKTLWISSIFEDMQKLCMQSFLNVGCEVEIYTYSPIKNIPNGVKLMNANEIIPKQYIFRDFHNSYATFSDWFRIKLLFLKGGWWVDSDMLCIKPFEIESEYVFATEKVMGNFEEIVTISNCVIKMEKRSVLGERLLLDIEKKVSAIQDKTQITWTEIGAKCLSEKIFQNNYTDYVVSPEVFCPVDYLNYKDMFSNRNFDLSDLTYGIHLWNKMWEWSKNNPLKEVDVNSPIYKVLENAGYKSL